MGFLNFITQLLYCLFAGFGVGVEAFLSILPLYHELSGIKEQLFAYFIGVPVIVVSILVALVKVIKILSRLTRT